MPKNEIDSDEVDASKDNSKVDAPEKKDEGDSGNADDSGNSQNDDEKKESDDKDEKKEEKEPEKKIDLEEETYKQRYADSTKEVQELKKDPAKLREFLGLDPDASLDEHFGVSKKETETKDDDEGSDEDDETDKDQKSSEDALPYDKMGVKVEEQAAIDLVWDNFAEKHPDIDKSSKVRESLTKNFFRFLQDEAGNRRKLKNVLEDTYRYISMDQEIEKAQKQARNEGIIKATANKEGADQSSSSKTTKTTKAGLNDAEKTMAAKLGIKEEDYLKNKQTEDNEN